MSRVAPTKRREVDVEKLRALLGDNRLAAARRIAGDNSDDVARVRRALQRIDERANKGRVVTVIQATAEEIASGYGVDPESFLRRLERPDQRVIELRRLGRRADKLRAELGWPGRRFEDELGTQGG